MEDIKVYEQDGKVCIKLHEFFTFASHTSFRNTYKDNKPRLQYTLNFSQTKYMDSSGLGMLLLLREHNGLGNIEDITLTGYTDKIETILRVANFQRLFHMT